MAIVVKNLKIAHLRNSLYIYKSSNFMLNLAGHTHVRVQVVAE